MKLTAKTAKIVGLIATVGWPIHVSAQAKDAPTKPPTAAASAVADSANAKGTAVVELYHGAKNDSRVLRFQNGKEIIQAPLNIPPQIQAQGSKVCVKVMNANPVLYNYAINTVVDSTSNALPDLKAFATLISGVAGSGIQPAVKFGTAPDDSTPAKWVEWYTGHLKLLAEDVNGAKKAAAASELPESAEDAAAGKVTERKGLRYTQAFLRDTLSDAPGHFNDPNLPATVASWKTAANGLLKGKYKPDEKPTAEELILVDALSAYGDALVTSRQSLSDTYGKADLVWQSCTSPLGEYPIGVFLAVTRKSTDGTVRRATGTLTALSVAPKQTRPSVELVPTFLIGYTQNTKRFSLDNDTIRVASHDAWPLHPAMFLMLNPVSYSDDDSFSFGIGLGVGFSDEAKTVVSEFVPFSLQMAYRNVIRIGLGVGWSQQPDHLKSGKVGDVIGSQDDLQKLIVTDKRPAIFAVFTLPGLSLKLK